MSLNSYNRKKKNTILFGQNDEFQIKKAYAFKWMAKVKGKCYVSLYITVLINLNNTLCSEIAHISYHDMWRHENCKILYYENKTCGDTMAIINKK
jgi:hypothetical protein